MDYAVSKTLRLAQNNGRVLYFPCMTRNIIFTLCFFGAITWLASPRIAAAQLAFGGFNIITIPCTASPGVFLVYTIPATGSPSNMLVTPASPYFLYGAYLTPEIFVTGLYSPVTAPCLVYAGVTVVQIGVGFPIIGPL